MPKKRFLNLPEEKRQRIVQATLEELSRVPVDEMSINKIVQAAGIPRGSFYQYFEDKNDLLDYIMQGYQALMLDNVQTILQEEGGDIFRLLTEALRITVEFGTKPENYAFCKNIFSHIRLCADSPFDITQFNIPALLDRFLPEANLAGFKYKSREDLADIVEMMILLCRRAVARVFADVGKKEQVQASFARQLEMLKHGILQAEGGAAHV